MDFPGLPGPVFWSALLAAIAVGGTIATILLGRRRGGAQHVHVLEAEVERLQDRVWNLAEGEERYRSLIRAQLDVIVQRDAAGRVTFANEGYARLTGRPGSDLLGTAAMPAVIESGPARARPDGARLVDEAIETPDGTRWFAFVETTIAGPGGAPETLRAGRDVTERVVTARALEEARARAEAASGAKSRFLATVSHEFRTPLNGILGMADLVLDTSLDPEQTTYIRAVKTSGEALLSLIDEILDFSKIEAGRIDLAAEPFDLTALVEGVVELLAPKAQGKGIEIAAHVARDAPRMVVGDGDRLRQILVNLAGNAVKFTETGGVGVTVEGDGEGIVLSVRDTGPGIAMERAPALFEEFEQGDDSASRRHGGTGLGLAITHRIVERMGGRIEVESTLGSGSNFRVRLNLPSLGGPDRTPTGSLMGRTVLILARSPFEGPFLQRRLEEEGAAVTMVETARDAMAAISAMGHNVLIADCALGEELVRGVAQEARRAGIPRSIVLLSPFDRRDFGSPGAAGFDGYLVKPVRARSLFQRLAETASPYQPTKTRHAPVQGRRNRAPAPRVLLAEDNEINALLARKGLEKLGAAVDWAKDGEEALAMAEASLTGSRPPYDLILMDIRMPGLDGLEATRRIRQIESALGRIEPYRIVALTANAFKEDEAAATKAGLDGLLAKPLDLARLAALLTPARSSVAKAS